MRLYPNMDYAAPNGIHYGVSAEIRSNSANQGNGSQGAAGASGATMVWYSGSVYVSSDKFGKLSIGATPADAIGTLAVGTGDDFGTGGFYGEYGIKNGPGFAMADTYFGDIPKQDILYVSPSFAGFTVAADWQPNSVGMNNSSGQTDGTDGGGQSRNRIEVAGKYAGAFGSTSLKVSAGYAHATANPVLGGPQTYNDVNLYTAGAVVGFAGFSVEGSIVGGKWNYASIDSGSDQGPPPKGGKSSTAFIVGPGYTIGPFAIGAQYYHVDFDASENGGLLGTTARVNGEALGASYVVGPGVTLEFDALASKVKTPQVGGGRTDLNGWGVALGTYFKW
jgi:predicted porin